MFTPACPSTSESGMKRKPMLSKIRRVTATVFFFKPNWLLYSADFLIAVEHLLLREHFKLCLSGKTGF
jgi:hypothetical protein